MTGDQTEAEADVGALLRKTERDRLRALVAGDLATAEVLHDDGYQLITPGGVSLSKRDYLDGIRDGSLRYRRFEPDGEMAVRWWGGGAAVRYQVIIEIDADGATYHDRCWHTDIYELRDGRWRAVWSHATRIKALG